MQRVALAMFVVALVVPASASGAQWRAPQLLSSDGDGSAGSPTTPAVAVDGDGAAVAAWTPIAGDAVKLRRAAATPGAKPWTPLKGSVSAGREGATAATRALRMEAWVDITDIYSDETGVLVRVRGGSGAAIESRQLALQPGGATLLRASAAPDGPLAVAWVEKAKARDTVVLWVRGADATWARVDVPAPAGFAHVSDLALALGGQGTVAIAALGDDRTVHATLRDAAGAWSEWRTVSGPVASAPQAAYTTPEGFVLAWTRTINSTTLAVEAAAALPRSGIGPVKVVDPGAARGPVRLSWTGPAAGVAAVWAADGPTARGGRIAFASRHPSGRWSSAATVASDRAERLSDPRLVGLSPGTFVAVWRRGGGPSGYVEGAVRKDLAGRFGAPQRISAPGTGAIGSLALGAGGRLAHVVWDGFTARTRTWRVYASRMRP